MLCDQSEGRVEHNSDTSLLGVNTKYLDSSYRYRCHDLQIQNVTQPE